MENCKAMNMAIDLLRTINEPVQPIKCIRTKSADRGELITGTCPKCGSAWLNNQQNNYCGGCGRRLSWEGVFDG